MIRALLPFDRFGKGERGGVGLLWLAGIAQGYAQAQATVTLPFARLSLELTEGQMSLILALTRLGGIGALAFSHVGDRHGRRRPFLIAFGLMMVVAAATGAATNPWQYAGLQSVVRLTTNAVGSLAVVLIAERVVPEVRAFALSLYAAGGSFGAGLATASLPLAEISPDGWRLTFALAALGLLPLPLLVVRLRESPLVSRSEPVGAPVRRLIGGPFARVFWVSAAAGLCAAAFPAVGLAFTTERLVDDLGFSAAAAAAISLTGGTIGATGLFVGGRVADLWGRRPTTLVALGLALVGGIAVFRVSQPGWLVGALAVASFGTFAYLPAAGSHRTELFPTELRATAATAGSVMAMAGSAAGLGLAGLTIDRIGLAASMALLAVFMLMAMALTLLLPETRGQSLANVRP